MAKGDTRCEDGRILRHDPQHDDPYLETDIGKCEECDGKGCYMCDSCEKDFPREQLHDGRCENCNEAAYDRQQEHLMETGGGPSLAEQQQAAYKIKRGLR